jgi:hypothetical protein
VATEHTSFRVKIATDRGIDLTRPPFDAFSSRLSSKTSYASTQPLGTAMRTEGVAAFTFVSARDPGQAHNLGIFDPAAFARTVPLGTSRTWHCLATRDRVIFSRRGALRRDPRSFPRALFERKGRLARVS